ncbi:MAG: pilin, partial [Candidatus Magasanikbacteria bacterium]|nr:pilin [Candidatus Magasanikbacteria bacterium]
DGSYSPSNIGGLINPLSGTTVPGFLGNIIGAVLGVVGSLALILFIYAGFQWMTARGNPEQVKSATKTMMWAALGLLMIFSSYMIVKFIFNAFGITEK